MSELIEFKVTEFELGKIQTNLDDIEALVDESLKKYTGLIVTEDQIADAKKMRANLNRVGKAANDWRIAKEKEFNEPFAVIKAQVKRITDKIKEASGEIDSQVKEFEAKEADEKRTKLTNWWLVNGNPHVKPEKIWEDRWLNKTITLDKAKTEMIRKKENISADLASIATISKSADMTNYLIAEYLDKLDLNLVLRNWQELEERKAAAEAERIRIEKEREERERRMAELAAKQAAAEAERPASEEAPAPAEMAAETARTPAPDEYLYSPTFKLVDITYSQAMAITEFMREHDIKFISVSKERRLK